MMTVNLFVSAIFVSCMYIGTLQESLKTHPPVWEYTYQFELFEKTYRLALYLQSELARLRNKLELTKCPTHWITGDDKCYRISQHRKLDWYKSQEACERVDGHLAVLDSPKEGDLVSMLLQNYSEEEQITVGEVWIGGYWSEEHWRWISGKRLSNTTDRLRDRLLDDIGTIAQTKQGSCLSWLEYLREASCKTKLHYLCERKPVSIT